MGDPAATRRLARAKTRAAEVLRDLRYGVVQSDNSTFCIVGIRKLEIRMVRVVIDEITEADKTCVMEFPHRPPNCSFEIWCKRENDPKFLMIEM